MAVSNTEIMEAVNKVAISAAVTESIVVDLKKAVMGNGKPGLLDRVQIIENLHTQEAERKKQDCEKKEKISARTWGVILIFVTQFAGLIVLFIRTGFH
jgi:CHASE3 domain sensor protein